MKKILFVMNTMGRAGAERALVALMNTLPKDQYEISLLVLINRGEIFDEIPEHVIKLNKKPDSHSVLSKGGTIKIIQTTIKCFFYHLRGFTLLKYFFKNFFIQYKKKEIHLDKLLWRIIAKGTKAPKEKYDLAVAYLEGASTYFVADCVSATKKAAFVHIDYEKAGYSPEIDLDAYEKIDRIFSVSKEAGESFLRLYPQYQEKMHLFRNIIDTNWIQSQSKDLLSKNDPIMQSTAKYKLLTVGRLSYQKAYDIAIPALKIVRQNGYDVDWFILGEGPLEKELKEQIASENLQEHFILLGTRKNPYPYYRMADIYVHATRFEGKSIAIEEAQVMNKAIIASDCTGNREQIENNKSGFLIPLSSDEIAKKIIELIESPQKRYDFEKASSQINLKHTEDLDAFYELLF